MSISTSTARFWSQVSSFFVQAKELGMRTSSIMEDIQMAAMGRKGVNLSDVAATTLPDYDQFRKEWAGVLGFLQHPDHTPDKQEFVLRQLTLVASGVRDVRLHDNCIALPLY